jgi:SsrA-binding protein
VRLSGLGAAEKQLPHLAWCVPQLLRCAKGWILRHAPPAAPWIWTAIGRNLGVIYVFPQPVVLALPHAGLASCGPSSYNRGVAKKTKKKGKQGGGNSIAVNRRARHDYSIEERLEAGIALEGWEIKSLRAGRGHLTESYVQLKGGEVWLIGAHISALPSASTHIQPESTRSRKLLLNRSEINKLIGAVERRGYTLVPLRLYWRKARVKLEVALAKGKKLHDKRASTKERDWQREKERALRTR